jgi:TonB-dependent SusC/RagA subfamily outer membrane receptor
MKPHKLLSAWIALMAAALMLAFTGSVDDDARFRRIFEALQQFTYRYPQQKIFLHLDKPVYQGGDNIWIKAYLVNGTDHTPDTLSTNLYVELISPFQTRVQIKRFQIRRGFGVGDFVLSDTLPEGLYQIRAFTSWMQNFDADYFYTQNFQVFNPGYKKLISPRQARENLREVENREKQAEQFDIQFMPEGGDLVSGLESLVGFKAVNQTGRGIAVEGLIVDDLGNTVTSFSSQAKGMGTFLLTPAKDRKYFALFPDRDRGRRVALPQVLPTGLVMRVEDHRDSTRIWLRSNRPPTADPVANEVILVGQIGGRIYYREIVRLMDGQAYAEFSKANYPEGIMQITAFSGRGEPQAERLVFINHMNFMYIRYSVWDTLTEDGRKTSVDITTTDLEGKPIRANISLAVSRERTAELAQNRDNIISNLLLTSDLKGYIEDPQDYFTDQSPATLAALDLLMLTQGWRRFDWDLILAGEYPKIRFLEERGLTVFGQITRDFFDIPLKNARVQLSVMDAYNDVFTQQTNEKGYFIFNNLVYYDTVSMKIEAWRPSGRRNLVIVLPEEKPNDVKKRQGNYQLTTSSERDNKAYRTERAVEAREAFLEEQEQLKEERESQLPTLYGEPDNVLRSEDFPEGSRDILDVMKGRIPGVNIVGSQVYIRGINSLTGNNQPLFLIDGVPTSDVESVRSIPVEDIDRVEVLKGPNASIYGVRGANGVIAIYTKRGQFMRRGVIEFDMLGYNRPRQFYQPRYAPADEPLSNYTIVWVPVIITDPSGRARVDFDKPAIPGDYRFVLQGISYVGHVGFRESVVNSQ